MPSRRQRRRAALPVLLIVALACGLGGDGPSDPTNVGMVPVPTKAGEPIGPPATATISTEGGTLSTPDGALTVTIPAGAVAAPTEFSITPIVNTARGALSGAFRLGPEGTTFAEPVTLTFKGLEEYPSTGGGIDDVGVAYHDASGFWLPVPSVTRDEGANTLSVETAHFSDWTLLWQTGTPTAEGPIRLVQTIDVPFSAQGRATVYLQSETAGFTEYILAGSLTVPPIIAVGSDSCVPDQTTKSWANAAEIDRVKGVFRWGIGVHWTLTCTATGGAVTTRVMAASFDTMNINLGGRCPPGDYEPGQFAEPEFLQGAYTTSCGTQGAVRGTWDIRGYQILIDPTSGLVTTEAGGTATFNVVLNKPPLLNVVVPVSSSNPAEGTVSPAQVTFTPADWSTPHVVTVTGVNEFIDDDDVVYYARTGLATGDPRYAGIDAEDVELTNADDDTAGLSADPASGLVTTEAGGTATFQLELTSQPLADVVVTLASSDTTEGTVSPATFTFNATNWNQAQTITLTGVNDFVDEGDVAYSIQVTAASADPKYQGLATTVDASNQDDDVAGFATTPSAGLVTTEAGGTATFTLALMSEPFADVVVTVASGDTTEGTVSPASLVFTAANWNVPQTITARGVNDFVDDGDVAFNVQLTGTSTDAGYGGRTGSVAVSNVDDDTAGFTASPSAGLVTTEAGGTAAFQLALSSQPLADVVVAIASGDTTEGTAGPASLTFTAATWNVPQTVTVTGADDFVADGAIPYAVQLTGASTDPLYGGRTGSVAATNSDNDFAGITVGAPSGTTTNEAGTTTATFTVALTSQPTADVTIPLASSDTTEGTVSAPSLVFTAANWNLPQTVTVTGADDLVADGAQAYTVAIGPATSGDPGYAGRDPADLGFTNTDNDFAGITVGAPNGPSTTEAGGTVTFTVVLTSQPTADVAVPVASQDTTEGTAAPGSVVFTAGNWNVPQTVTVTGVNDDVADGNVSYVVAVGPATSADAGYGGRDPSDVTLSNADNDFAGITVGTPSTTTTTEAGGTATFTVVLTSQPTADVTIPITSLDTTEGDVSTAGLTFTAANWNAPQTVTVTGVDDAAADGLQAYTVVIGTAVSSDPGYAGRDPADLAFSNTDNDLVGVTVGAPSTTTTTEAGGLATFTLRLTSQPFASVTVPVSSSDTTEGTVAPASVVFDGTNWNVPQTVTVTGVDDAVADGPQGFTAVIGPAASSDAAYQGQDPADLAFTNTDNDNAGLLASPTTGLGTTEGGGTASFTVRLSSQPTGDVTVAVASSDSTEGTAAPASLIFTAATWNQAQTVTVTGVNDAVVDGPIAYTVSLTASGGDYAGRTGSVSVTNSDDDVAGIAVGAPSGTTTSEAGTSQTFTLVLGSQPTGDVTIPVASSDTTEGAVAPASVTFTAANWNVAQVVTVTGANDALADGNQLYTVTIGAATSADSNYAGRDPADLTFTNTDDDVAGLVASPTSGLATTEAGGTATFQLRLSSQPTADVVVGVTSSDTTEGTVAPTSVTFTSGNWNATQTVTVTGVDDLVTDGSIAYAVQLAAASTDAGYQGATASVSAANADDDVSGITVGAPSGTVTSEAATFVTFTVRLTSQPTADVTIPLSSSDATEGAVSPIQLVFTSVNWSAPQTVTVTGVDDSLADGTLPFTIAIGPATSGDATYQGQDPADLAFTNTDNDIAGLVATPVSGLTTTEAGGTATFQLRLSSQPTASVTVTLATNDATEGTVAPTSATFTTTSWNTAQTVTVTGVDDAVADGPIAYAIDLTAASPDLGYAGRTGTVSVTNSDNDAAGIVVGAPSGATTSELGAAVTFTIVLGSQPTADVTIPVSTSDPSEGVATPANVVFTSADWNQPQTVTVTGVNDAVDDGDQVYDVVIGISSSTDPSYGARNPADFVLTNTDDDAAGLVASPSSGLITSEAGGTATFQLSLASQPTGSVTVSLASTNAAEGTVSPASVTFTTSSWNVAQQVAVTGVDDAAVDGIVAYSITLTAAGADYAGRTGSVSVSNSDNDSAGLIATPSAGLNTTEAGGTATFQLRLSSQPTANVVVSVASDDSTEGSASPANVTFTSGNWNANQTITVTGANDDAVDGAIAYAIQLSATSGDATYQGRTATVSATNADNDAAGIVVGNASGTTTSESGAPIVTFTVALASQPAANVTIPVTSTDPAEGAPSPTSLVFTPSDWSSPQTVTVSGVNDFAVDGSQPYAITLGAATSTDANYAGRTAAGPSLTNLDDDAAGLVATPTSGLTTTEAGGTATFQLRLSSQPTANVVVSVTSGDPSEGTVSPGTVTFTSSNWNVNQQVTVTGVDDALADGAVPYAIQLAASGDAAYVGRTATISVTNSDNDAASITVSPASGTATTSELGATVTFTIVLTAQPISDVTIPLSSSDPAEGTVAPANVVFTSANWDVPQLVTVTGVDDLVDDGAVTYWAVIGAATGDPTFAGIDPTDVFLTNADDDTAGLVASPSSGLVTTEAGGTATFQLSLASQPTGTVTVSFASTDTGEGTVAPPSVTFTTGNWNVAQQVTVTGVDDAAVDGIVAYSITLTAAGADYAGRTGTVSVSNSDNDAAGLIATPSAGLNTTEAGGTATFQLRLASQPTANVVVSVASDDSTEGSASPANVTFTSGNWNANQTITVTGANDDAVDGAVAYAIQLSATSGDASYQGRTAAVSASNADNDAAGIVVGAASGTNTSESGTSVTFTVALTSQPVANVTIPVTSTDLTEGAPSPTSLVFTPSDWSSPQTVTVSGVNDFAVDGSQPYAIALGAATSTDANYAGRTAAGASLTNLDDDAAGLVATPTSGLTTTEAGGTATFQLRLSSQPTANVVVSVTSTDPGEGSVSPASVTFDSASWNVNQTITVTGVDDALVDGAVPYAVQLAASGDAAYVGRTATVSVTNSDNDAASITVSPASGTATTSELGATVTFTIVLTAQPVSGVTIPLSSSDPAEGTVAPASVVFTSANWNVPQLVTVTGMDDLVDDGAVTYWAVIGAATGDPAFAGIDPTDVFLTNADDDTAGLVASPSSGLVTTEAGGTATFQLSLASQPTGTVTVSLASTDTGEGTVAPPSVTFTTGNWNIAQPVTITGEDDAAVDGSAAYAITLTASGADYAGRTGTVSVSNSDNDAAGLIATPSAGLNTTEAGGTATLQLRLASQPTASVTVNVLTSDPTEGTASPASVTFTTSNWNVDQPVTVAGVDDAVDDGDVGYAVQLSAASGDASYQGRTGSISATNADDDTAGIAVSTPPSGLSTSELGATVTFSLVLTAQPTADVTIPVSSNNTSEGTVSAASLVFTPGNWSTPQTVTVTGVNDAFDDGDQFYDVVLGGSTSGDPSYLGLDLANYVLTNVDDDAAGLVATPSSGLVTSETGGFVTFEVRLASQPTGTVTVDVESDTPTEGTAMPTTLTFVPSEWNVPQTVTVTGVDDLTTDDDVDYVVLLTASSADLAYQGAAAPVSLTNTGDGAAGFAASPLADAAAR